LRRERRRQGCRRPQASRGRPPAGGGRSAVAAGRGRGRVVHPAPNVGRRRELQRASASTPCCWLSYEHTPQRWTKPARCAKNSPSPLPRNPPIMNPPTTRFAGVLVPALTPFDRTLRPATVRF